MTGMLLAAKWSGLSQKGVTLWEIRKARRTRLKGIGRRKQNKRKPQSRNSIRAVIWPPVVEG